MIIESDVAKASRYSDDALEAFYIAVENGQARMALQILVDVISEFETKIDNLEKFCNLNQEQDKSEEVITEQLTAAVEENKEEKAVTENQTKPQPKTKVQEKESE